jgi:hypothetical protein
MNRLWLGYSMNHIYYYEKSGWNHGYRIHQFKDWTIPASILTYPIAPVFKVTNLLKNLLKTSGSHGTGTAIFGSI